MDTDEICKLIERLGQGAVPNEAEWKCRVAFKDLRSLVNVGSGCFNSVLTNDCYNAYLALHSNKQQGVLVTNIFFRNPPIVEISAAKGSFRKSK